MISKKLKKVNTIEHTIEEDENIILSSLMERYWRLIKTEEIGKTASVTKAIDKLEIVIKNHTQNK